MEVIYDPVNKHHWVPTSEEAKLILRALNLVCKGLTTELTLDFEKYIKLRDEVEEKWL